MRWKRLLLLIPALAVVAAANLRWVCTVRVDGIPLSGSWTPQSIERAERLALEAAGEVARGDTALPYVRGRDGAGGSAALLLRRGVPGLGRQC